MQPWSADSLASFVSVRLADVPLVVVSNRQSNIYRWAADTLDVLARLAATRAAA